MASSSLQQGSPEWLEARKGKLTASNIGAALGLCSWTSRKVAFARAIGTDTFEGNEATRWGSANESNALAAYSAHTGNVVEPTGLHVHKNTPWLAGSPDGLIGTEGMVEAKCPYWKKEVHEQVPIYYYMQMNACLECADRQWCDYISWTPSAYKIIRVMRDHALHQAFLTTEYADFYRAMCDVDSNGEFQGGPPKWRKGHKEIIREMVEESMRTHINADFWNRDRFNYPPTPEQDETWICPPTPEHEGNFGEVSI